MAKKKLKKKRKKKPKSIESLIYSQLRKIWWFNCPGRKEALQRAKVDRKKLYICESCLKKTDKPQVDHVLPVGARPRIVKIAENDLPTWDDYITRLFIEASGLQVLCAQCHLEKTRKDRDQHGKS